MRLIVHAGFHKTGTTSVQNMLRHNRATLSAQYRIITRHNFEAVCEAARAWSIRREDVEMGLYHYELAHFLEPLADDPRPVVISAEDLSGHMPGRHGLLRYDAAPALMTAICDIAAQIAPNPQITFALSLRRAKTWMTSCYGQHLRAIRMTKSQTDYCAQMAPHADLATDAAAIKSALGARAAVASWWLESLPKSDPLGPLAPLLDLMQTPADLRARLLPLPPSNTALPPDALDALLSLNRSDLDRDALRRAKQVIIRAAQRP